MQKPKYHLHQVARTPESYEVRDEDDANYGTVRRVGPEEGSDWYCRRSTGDVTPATADTLEGAVRHIIGTAEFERP